MYAQKFLSEFVLGVTTIGVHHGVPSATGVMMFCDWSRSTIAVSLSQYESRIIHECVYKMAGHLPYRDAEFFPCITLIWLSKTVGYLPLCVARHAGCSDDNIDGYYTLNTTDFAVASVLSTVSR